MMVVLQFCENGDLQSFLENNNGLVLLARVNFALQIAQVRLV